ncbi:hypothetical protein JTE90_025360 [Oedothorax gibbosus]|uniref:MYND-type domain-containing protein n=1 Tax=Oedothorax gibbosus TaxID=931172 RepID=A0AAV6U9H9_9ARAC|nr:hypothetical protein JTE90_025360 [Oedothorax gibbosus]
MKFEKKSDDSIVPGFMFGLVILGPAAGKLKYTLLDKQDITLLQNYILEAYVDVDRNGEGACVFALAYDIKRGKDAGRYIQDILWEKHYGGIAPGFKVAHRNGITVDNRLENLTLQPKENSHFRASTLKDPEHSLYWSAVVEMPHEAEPLYMKLFTAHEEISLLKEERYFECHYPPCTRIEQRPQEFHICSLCHITRYCSATCQSLDWSWHEPICLQRPRPLNIQGHLDR